MKTALLDKHNNKALHHMNPKQPPGEGRKAEAIQTDFENILSAGHCGNLAAVKNYYTQMD